MNELQSVGVGGILAIIILREVFNFLKTRKPDKICEDIKIIKSEVRDLSQKIGYNNSNSDKWLERLTLIQEKQTELLNKIITMIAVMKEK